MSKLSLVVVALVAIVVVAEAASFGHYERQPTYGYQPIGQHGHEYGGEFGGHGQHQQGVSHGGIEHHGDYQVPSSGPSYGGEFGGHQQHGDYQQQQHHHQQHQQHQQSPHANIGYGHHGY